MNIYVRTIFPLETSQSLFGRQFNFHALYYILVNIGQLETQTNSQSQKSQTTQKGCDGEGLYIFLKPNINHVLHVSCNSQWLTGGRALLHCTVLGATRRTVSKKLQNYCKNIAKILQTYFKNIPKIFVKQPDVRCPKIFQSYSQNILTDNSSQSNLFLSQKIGRFILSKLIPPSLSS